MTRSPHVDGAWAVPAIQRHRARVDTGVRLRRVDFGSGAIGDGFKQVTGGIEVFVARSVNGAPQVIGP